MYCVVRANLLAQTAAYAARLAHVHNVLAPVLRGTRNVNLCRFGYALYKIFGAGTYAQPAAYAQILVYCRHPFVNLNGKIGAYVHAAACAHAPHLALFSAVRKQLLRNTASVTLIGIFVVAGYASAARHHRHGLLSAGIIYSEYVGNFYFVGFCCLTAIVKTCLAFNQRARKPFAAGMSAAAAVSSAQM
jgi:hypothetical protein